MNLVRKFWLGRSYKRTNRFCITSKASLPKAKDFVCFNFKSHVIRACIFAHRNISLTFWIFKVSRFHYIANYIRYCGIRFRSNLNETRTVDVEKMFSPCLELGNGLQGKAYFSKIFTTGIKYHSKPQSRNS